MNVDIAMLFKISYEPANNLYVLLISIGFHNASFKPLSAQV